MSSASTMNGPAPHAISLISGAIGLGPSVQTVSPCFVFFGELALGGVLVFLFAFFGGDERDLDQCSLQRDDGCQHVSSLWDWNDWYRWCVLRPVRDR